MRPSARFLVMRYRFLCAGARQRISMPLSTTTTLPTLVVVSGMRPGPRWRIHRGPGIATSHAIGGPRRILQTVLRFRSFQPASFVKALPLLLVLSSLLEATASSSASTGGKLWACVHRCLPCSSLRHRDGKVVIATIIPTTVPRQCYFEFCVVQPTLYYVSLSNSLSKSLEVCRISSVSEIGRDEVKHSSVPYFSSFTSLLHYFFLLPFTSVYFVSLCTCIHACLHKQISLGILDYKLYKSIIIIVSDLYSTRARTYVMRH